MNLGLHTAPLRVDAGCSVVVLVVVAAAVFLLDDVAGLGQVGDDAVGAGSVMPRLAGMSRSRTPGSCAMHSSTRAWLVRKVRHHQHAIEFWKTVASFQVRA